MKSIIFDMDGVIFDTEQLTLDCWRKISSEYHMPDIDKVYISCIGTNDQKTLGIFNDYYGDQYPILEIRQRVTNLLHQEIEQNGPPVKPFVRELLTYLHCNEYKIALASSTNTMQVERELKAADLYHYFHTIVGGDMVNKSKPAPDIFLHACSKLCMKPNNTFIVEDSENGIRAAFSAGAKPIMVPDLITPTIEIRKMCTKICNDLNDVKQYLSYYYQSDK